MWLRWPIGPLGTIGAHGPPLGGPDYNGGMVVVGLALRPPKVKFALASALAFWKVMLEKSPLQFVQRMAI